MEAIVTANINFAKNKFMYVYCLCYGFKGGRITTDNV